MGRRLFCEISPLTYRLSVLKGRLLRRVRDFPLRPHFARQKITEPLPCRMNGHSSLIRRKLGNVDMTLQENKAVNLSLAAPKVNGTLIRPGEIFSFWHLVGNTTKRKGYREGLTISSGQAAHGIGGGLCQFTNLIHWMVLHSELTLMEHHHHDGFDLFPDYNRQIPFGVGTSILYNYLDYRFKNNTDCTFQLLVHTNGTHLCGELRAERPSPFAFHIAVRNEYFIREGEAVYRSGEVFRQVVDKKSGNTLENTCIRKNHAKVMYTTEALEILSAPPGAEQ